ncbi:MAG TPA: hypothetical protein VMR18_03195 [Candidatus Saccharimonadales bacterium]|nr:hypothetical protein [Candidatus Saccharimonadales bacterium]
MADLVERWSPCRSTQNCETGLSVDNQARRGLVSRRGASDRGPGGLRTARATAPSARGAAHSRGDLDPHLPRSKSGRRAFPQVMAVGLYITIDTGPTTAVCRSRGAAANSRSRSGAALPTPLHDRRPKRTGIS